MTSPHTLIDAPVFFNPTLDTAFKKVFNLETHKDLLISFLNAILRRKEGEKIIEVNPLPQEMLSIVTKSKKSVLDVRCKDEKGNQYVVEMQNKGLTNFIQRVHYYASRVYISSLQEGGNYGLLKPTILISILNKKLFDDRVKYVSYHNTLEEETGECFLNHISYIFVELPKFDKKEGEIHSIMDWWIDLFANAKSRHTVPNGSPSEILDAYHILDSHKWTMGERLAYEDDMMGRMDAEDEIETAMEEGIELGIEKGIGMGIGMGRSEEREIQERLRAEERAEIEKKRLEERMENARRLLKKGLKLEDVQEALQLSTKEMVEFERET